MHKRKKRTKNIHCNRGSQLKLLIIMEIYLKRIHTDFRPFQSLCKGVAHTFNHSTPEAAAGGSC